MPPKFKFTKEEIIQSSINLIRQKGWNTLSTRTLANELGSSARPIYSFFKSMGELEEELVKKAVELLYECMVRERTGDPWIDHGIGYVLFAQEEKHLFRGINNEKNIKYFKKYGDLIWNTLTNSLSDYPAFQGLSADQIYKIQGTRWLFAHGLAFQVNNPPPETWDNKTIINVMKEGSLAILDGLKNRMNSTE